MADRRMLLISLALSTLLHAALLVYGPRFVKPHAQLPPQRVSVLSARLQFAPDLQAANTASRAPLLSRPTSMAPVALPPRSFAPPVPGAASAPLIQARRPEVVPPAAQAVMPANPLSTPESEALSPPPPLAMVPPLLQPAEPRPPLPESTASVVPAQALPVASTPVGPRAHALKSVFARRETPGIDLQAAVAQVQQARQQIHMQMLRDRHVVWLRDRAEKLTVAAVAALNPPPEAQCTASLPETVAEAVQWDCPEPAWREALAQPNASLQAALLPLLRMTGAPVTLPLRRTGVRAVAQGDSR